MYVEDGDFFPEFAVVDLIDVLGAPDGEEESHVEYDAHGDEEEDGENEVLVEALGIGGKCTFSVMRKYMCIMVR